MKQHCLAFALTIALAGCAPAPVIYKTTHYGPVPSDYEKVVKDFFATELMQPGSVRNMQISKVDPEKSKFFINSVLESDKSHGYLVCVTFEASPAPGAPLTSMTEGVVLHHDRVIHWLKGGWWAEINRCDSTMHLSF